MKNTNAKHGTQKQSGKPLPRARQQNYVYHWDRIIGAGGIFLVLCGLAGYGLYWWFGSSPKEEFDMADTPPGAEVAVEDAQAPLLNETIIAEDNPVQKFAENKPLEKESPSPEMAQLSATDQANEATVAETVINELDIDDSGPADTAQPSEEMLAVPPNEELSEPQVDIPQNIPLAAPQGEIPDSSDTTLTVDTPNSPFQLNELEILEPSVKRFLLVKSVSNREPKGELSEIRFAADGSAAVWVYSELIDKKGSRFKYVWLHGGKRIVTVPVNVGGNRWRSYSSKVINRSMSGTWRVELQDGKDRLMASADFFVE